MEQGVDIVTALLLADDIGTKPVVINASDDGSGIHLDANWAALRLADGTMSLAGSELIIVKAASSMIGRGAARFDTSTIAKVSSALLKFAPQLGFFEGTIIAADNVFVCRPIISSFVFPSPTIYQEVRAGYLSQSWGIMSEVSDEYVYDFTADYESVAQLDIGFAEASHDVGGAEPIPGTDSLATVNPYLELVVSSDLDPQGPGGSKDWSIHRWREPSRPVKCITVYELDGDRLGRRQRAPRDLTIMPRVQIRVRSPEVPEAMTKLQYIEMIMDAAIDRTITLSPPVGGDYTVLVKHVQRSDNFALIGRDDNGAFLWTLNLRIALG